MKLKENPGGKKKDRTEDTTDAARKEGEGLQSQGTLERTPKKRTNWGQGWKEQPGGLDIGGGGKNERPAKITSRTICRAKKINQKKKRRSTSSEKANTLIQTVCENRVEKNAARPQPINALGWG